MSTRSVLRLPPRLRDGPTVVASLALAGLAAIVLYQLLAPPIVGLADNGDYERIMLRFGLFHESDDYDDRYWKYLNLRFRIGEETDPIRYASSQELVVGAAWLAAKAVSSDTFDLRVLGVLNAILLLAAAGLLLFTARRLGLACTIALGLLLLLMVGDVGYVSYLNSIYSEPASLVSFLLLVAIGLRLILYEETGRRQLYWYGAFLASLVLLASAKPQNTILAILLAPLAYRLWPRPERGFRDPWRVGVVLGLVGFAVWFASYSTPAVLRQLNLYNSVFNEILKFSEEPRADLRSLGLDPELARLAGTNAFEPDVPVHEEWFVSSFHDRIGYGDIVRFYATHPGRFVEAVDRTAASTFRLRPPSYGNFPVSAGRPPGAHSESFDWWSDFGDEVLPRSDWFLGLFVLVNVLALGLKARLDRHRGDRLLTELHAAALLVALYQFAAVTLAEGELDAVKHLFLFNVAADACLAFLAIYAVALLRRRRRSPSVQPTTRATQISAGRTT